MGLVYLPYKPLSKVEKKKYEVSIPPHLFSISLDRYSISD
jgi:hypothetical protein